MIWNAIFYLLSECTISVDENSNFAILKLPFPDISPVHAVATSTRSHIFTGTTFPKKGTEGFHHSRCGSFRALFIVAKQRVTLFTPWLCDFDSDSGSGSGALWCRVLIKLENSSSRSKRAARRAIQRGKVKTETHKQRQGRRNTRGEGRLLLIDQLPQVLCGHFLPLPRPLSAPFLFRPSDSHSQAGWTTTPRCLRLNNKALTLFFVPRWSVGPNGSVQFIKTWIATGLAERLFQAGNLRQEDDGSDPPHCSSFQQ